MIYFKLMKRLLRSYLISALSLYLATQIAQGLAFEKGLQTFLIASAGLTLAQLVGKPVINILLLPLNLVTFGLFRWVSSGIILYLVSLLVPGFKILKFFYKGFASPWIDIPVINLQGFLAIVAFALMYSVIISSIYWLKK